MHRHGQPLVDQKSLSRETGREGGRGQNEKKVNQFFWLLGFRESQGSRQSHAQKVTLPDKGAPRVFAGVDLAV